jgi:inositol transport system substrate-binding protein
MLASAAALGRAPELIDAKDGTPDALDQMKKGNLKVTVFQDARAQGRGAIDAAVKLAKGEKVDRFVMIPYELITPENYKSYLDR